MVGVAAVAVLGVLYDNQDPAGEMAALGVERRGEVAADVEEDDLGQLSDTVDTAKLRAATANAPDASVIRG